MVPAGSKPPVRDERVVITRVAENGWRQLREVRVAALTDSPAAFGSTLERELTFTEDRWKAWPRAGGVFVATSADVPVGIAAGMARDSAEERLLVSMWVSPRWRGQGVARALTVAVTDWARSAGARRLVLWVTDGNEAARLLYERQGFRATGRRKPLPSNAVLFESEMLLDLD